MERHSEGADHRALDWATQCPGIAARVITYVLENYAEEITLDDLAGQAGLSRYNFCRRFHRECGLPPMRWLWYFRTLLAAEFIRIDPRWSLTDIAFACGFSSSAHFSRSFRAALGESPSVFRRNVQDGERWGNRQGEDIFVNNGQALRRAVHVALTPRAG